MKSRWNARGDTTSSVVLWAGSLLAGFICVMWLTNNIGAEQAVIQQVDNDLSELVNNMNTACAMERYQKMFNPKLSKGTVIFSNSTLCIDSSPCQVKYYEGSLEAEFLSGEAVIAGARECTNPELCKRIYYSSDKEPVVDAGGIRIPEAALCTNTIEPFLRCRTLYCWTGLSKEFFIEDIVRINLTKAGGAYNATAQ